MSVNNVHSARTCMQTFATTVIHSITQKEPLSLVCFRYFCQILMINHGLGFVGTTNGLHGSIIGTHTKSVKKGHMYQHSSSATHLSVGSLKRLYGVLQLQRTLRGYLVRRRLSGHYAVCSAARFVCGVCVCHEIYHKKAYIQTLTYVQYTQQHEGQWHCRMQISQISPSFPFSENTHLFCRRVRINRLMIVQTYVAPDDDGPSEPAPVQPRESTTLAPIETAMDDNSALDILYETQHDDAHAPPDASGHDDAHAPPDASRHDDAHAPPDFSDEFEDESPALLVATPFQQWVAERHLKQYAAAFDSSGYADIELIRHLTQEETEDMLATTFASCG